MIKDVIKFIHGATTEDINLIIDAIKLRRNQIHTSKAQTFKVGDKVQFKGRYGRTEKGTVTRVKVKYLIVDTGMARWNVPGNNLTKIEETA